MKKKIMNITAVIYIIIMMLLTIWNITNLVEAGREKHRPNMIPMVCMCGMLFTAGVVDKGIIDGV